MSDYATTSRETPRDRFTLPITFAAGMWLCLVLFAALVPGADAAEPGNRAPVANAGAPQTAVLGQRVTLDASASVDVDGDRLKYRWTLVSTPATSAARLLDASAVRPQFDVDLLGDYVAEVVVFDGAEESAPQRVVVSTGNSAPVAVAPPGGTIALGDAIVLGSELSFDDNGDALTARWQVIDQPEASRASFYQRGAGSAVLQADVPGDFLLQLTVSDGQFDSAPVQVRYSTIGSAPRADAGDDRASILGARLRLDGSRSVDDDDQALGFRWALLHAPAGSRTALDGANTPTPTLAVDLPGLYVAQLIVSDGVRDSSADTVVIEARGRSDQADARTPILGRIGAGTSARGGGSDVDSDGVPDSIDNCVEEFNPSQLDSNGDGFGNRCDPDLDNDGFITNVGDLAILKMAFFSTPGAANWNPDADFNGDGVVNFVELGIMREYFFGPPGPIANEFINPAGGTWHDPNNWSLGIVPNTVHAVRIDLGPGLLVTYSTGDSRIASMRTTSDFALSGGALEIAGTMQVNAPFAISGGTLADAIVLAPSTSDEIQVDAAATFDNVTLAQDVTVNNGHTLTVHNGLSLSGSMVTLASTGSTTRLALGNPVAPLDGTGEIVFDGTTTNDTRNELYRSGSGGALIVGSGITVRAGTTGGRINAASFGQEVEFGGTLISDLPGRIVGVTGTQITFTSSAAVNVAGGDLDLAGPWLNEGTLTGTGGTFDINTTNASGQVWDNDGTISLTDTVAELSGTFSPDGIGAFTSNTDVILNGILQLGGQSFDLAALPGNLVFGAGTIADGTLVTTPFTLMDGNLTLDSMILAVDATVGNGRTLTAQNGLTLDGSAVSLASTGGTTRLALAGSNGLLDGSGEVVFNGTTTNDTRNELYRSGSGGALAVGSGITVRTGSVGGRVNSASFGQPLTFGGTLISDVPARTVFVTGSPMTFTASANLNLFGGDVSLAGSWVNEGTITGTGGTFDSNTTNGSTQTWDNNGTISLTDTVAELSGTFTPDDLGAFTSNSDVIINGILQLGGQNFDLDTLPGNPILTSGTIANGTLVTTPLTLTDSNFTLDAVILSVDALVNNGRTLTAQNGLTLNGATVTLASTGSTTRLSMAGTNGLLAGSGEVVFGGTTLNDTRNELYRGGSGAALTVGLGITVRSDSAGGRINSASFGQPLVIDGTVISSLPGRTVNVTGTPITFGPSANLTLIGGDVALAGAWTNEGAVTGTGGNFDLNTSNTSSQTWDNNGVITLTDTVAELSGTFGPDDIGNFTSNANVILNGILQLGGQSFDLGALPGNPLLSAGRIENGTLVTTPLTLTGNNFTLVGMTLEVDATVNNGRTLSAQNGLTLDGSTITLASTSSTTRLAMSGSSALLDGSGDIVFGGTASSDTRNELYRSGSGGALTVGFGITVRTDTAAGRINSASFSQPLTIEGSVVSDLPGHTVNLTGTTITLAPTASVALSGGGNVSLAGSWVNEGTITGTGGTLDTNTTNTSSNTWDNNGTISLTGTVAELSATFGPADIGTFSSDADVLLNGRLELDNQGFDLGSLPGNPVLSAGTIANGTLTTTPFALTDSNFTLDAVTLAVDATVNNGRTLTAQNGLTLSGSTVTLASTAATTRLAMASSDASLDGTGEVVFGGTTTNDTRNELYRSGSGGALTVGSGITVRSDTAGGRINASSFGQPLVIEGAVISDLSARTVNLTGTSITINGDLEAQAGATINFGNPFTVGAGGTLSVDIGGTTTADYGRYTSPLAATLDGTLAISLVNAFTPTLGDTFEVLTFSSRTGTFATESGTDIGGGQALQVNYNATDVTLETVAAP